MKLDPKELICVAAAAAPRFDLYGGIHKALRAYLADTLLAVGRLDPDDSLERAEVTERVLQLLDFCGGHLRHENEFIHPALEARASGASARIAHDHEDHLRAIARLAELVGVLRACEPAQRPAAAAVLYRELALFVADNYQHMHVEETAHNAVLWARYTDAELVALHDLLVASIPPQEMLLTARWLVPFMNPSERVALLSDMRAKAPAPAFAAVLDTVRPQLAAREWEKLQRALAG